MKWIKILLLQVASVIPQTPSAQEVSKLMSHESSFSMFREPSYITFTGGAGNIEKLIFEADIMPYYLLKLSNSDRWGIELSPEVIMRMYNEESLPVRTPSFMPRITGFYQFRESNNGKPDLFGYISLWHHSNGQENNFYNEDSITINTRSGNFSTNSIEGGFFMSEPDKRHPFVTRYIKFSSLYHFAQAEELKSIYGDLRFFIDLQGVINITKTLRALNILPNNTRPNYAILYLSTKFGYIADDYNHYKALSLKRLIFKGTLSYKPSFLRDVTLFTQYYYGQDYYNIYFARQLHVLRIGLMAKPFFIN